MLRADGYELELLFCTQVKSGIWGNGQSGEAYGAYRAFVG